MSESLINEWDEVLQLITFDLNSNRIKYLHIEYLYYCSYKFSLSFLSFSLFSSSCCFSLFICSLSSREWCFYRLKMRCWCSTSKQIDIEVSLASRQFLRNIAIANIIKFIYRDTRYTYTSLFYKAFARAHQNCCFH